MPVISYQVWKHLVSPKDKKLKERLEFEVNERKITAILFKSNENLSNYVDDEDNLSINSRKKLKNFNCFNRENKYLTKYYLAKVNENRTEINNRKLIIIFPGRNFSLTRFKKIKYLEKIYQPNHVYDYDCAVLIYPIKAKDLSMLSQSCERALSHLIEEQQYKPENIFIMGWCLGGYFANETLAYYNRIHLKSELRFGCFINNKSFSDMNHFLYFIMPKYCRFILNFYPVKFYLKKWDSDSSKSLESFQNIFNLLVVIYSDSDNIINGLSHLYKHFKMESNIKVIKDDRKSHLPNWELITTIFNSA